MPAGYVIYADNTTRYFNPSHPVLFWKLYWNKNQVKFLFSHFFVVPLRPS